MSETLRFLSDELARVDAAIAGAPLFRDPGDPTSGFSDALVQLAAEEERIVSELAREARDLVVAD